MKKLILSLLLSVAVISTAYAKPIIIKDDPGGLVEQQIRWQDRIADAGIPVIIDGECDSACTFILRIPNVCVTEHASLGFHGASEEGSNGSSRVLRDQSISFAREFYPKPLFKWYLDNVIADYDQQAKSKKGQVDNRIHFLSGEELVAMGATKACE